MIFLYGKLEFPYKDIVTLSFDPVLPITHST